MKMRILIISTFFLLTLNLNARENGSFTVKSGYAVLNTGIHYGFEYAYQLSPIFSIKPSLGYFATVGFSDSFAFYSSGGNTNSQPYVDGHEFVSYDGRQSTSLTLCLNYSPLNRNSKHRINFGVGAGYAFTVQNYIDYGVEAEEKYVSVLAIMSKNLFVGKASIDYSFRLTEVSQTGFFIEVIGTGYDPETIIGLKYSHQLK